MGPEGTDEPVEELSNGTAEQSFEQGIDSALDQAADRALEQTSKEVEQPEGSTKPALKEGEFELGGKVWTKESLWKAYGESQKGHTQASQRAARERQIYSGMVDHMKKLLADPTKRDLFIKLSNGELTAAQLGAQKPQSVEAPKAPQDNEVISEIQDKIVEIEAQREYDTFISKHPELSAEEVEEVVLRTVQLERNGKERSLEEVYRHDFFDKAMAKHYSKGQQKAKEATKDSKGAALGSSPSTAKSEAQKKPKYNVRGSQSDQNSWLDQKLREVGAKFEDEEY